MKLFIIPGAGENTRMKPYKELAREASSIGYIVKTINPDWKRPLHEQIFKVGKEDVVFGFSRGALLAYITTKKYPCSLAVLASMTPLRKFSKAVITQHYGKEIANDLLKIKFTGNKTRKIKLAGVKEKEHIKANIYIPQTGHYINKRYRKNIIKILKEYKK